MKIEDIINDFEKFEGWTVEEWGNDIFKGGNFRKGNIAIVRLILLLPHMLFVNDERINVSDEQLKKINELAAINYKKYDSENQADELENASFDEQPEEEVEEAHKVDSHDLIVNARVTLMDELIQEFRGGQICDSCNLPITLCGAKALQKYPDKYREFLS
jgi:hypothetical protein